ncbi:hypothetical protein [Sphingomonas glaciei]|uniref:Uncharacterized protein n=1 Tax=Sphingomonas glaciei TaxID=2938948 RepID=A0ABY5MWV8_9SPHN|nr:hypothetical protein [Sphingomonas glaciei]UUR08291.1 hypothetical protein M1K48_01180 [Sphingomonas glaciei]
MPFQPNRELLGEPGEAFLRDILDRIVRSEGRKRALKPADAALRQHTIKVLLANLAVAALNRRNPRKFVALSLNSNDYANTGLSFTAVQLAFNQLQTLGLAIGRKGVAKPDGVNEQRGMRSRLRAKRAMRELMEVHGLRPEGIRNPPRNLIELKGNAPSAGPEPADVQASRVMIERINGLLANSDLQLADYAWERIRARTKLFEDLSDEERRHRQYLGDMTAKRLFRVFTRQWHLGGRLYGGWWIGVPKSERALITIDGEPTVELDYAQLHPTMLFATVGLQLDYDPYEFDGFSRELGKETFMRLLNRERHRGGRYIRRAGAARMPEGIEPSDYVARYKRHLAPVRHLLGEGMGLRLQRQDSDLALAVLDALAQQGIVALPIHDSFIVKKTHEHALRLTMTNTFTSLFGYESIVK